MTMIKIAFAALLFISGAGVSFGSTGLQKCVLTKNNQQFCTIDGNVGVINSQVSIYNGPRWIASGTVVKNKGKSVIRVTESFQRVQAGDSIAVESNGNSELFIKSSFSKPDSY